MDPRKHVGTLMTVTAGVHIVLELAFFGNWLLDILRAGVGNLNWTLEALASYWFVIFAWPLFLLGYVTQWAYPGRVSFRKCSAPDLSVWRW